MFFALFGSSYHWSLDHRIAKPYSAATVAMHWPKMVIISRTVQTHMRIFMTIRRISANWRQNEKKLACNAAVFLPKRSLFRWLHSRSSRPPLWKLSANNCPSQQTCKPNSKCIHIHDRTYILHNWRNVGRPQNLVASETKTDTHSLLVSCLPSKYKLFMLTMEFRYSTFRSLDDAYTVSAWPRWPGVGRWPILQFTSRDSRLVQACARVIMAIPAAFWVLSTILPHAWHENQVGLHYSSSGQRRTGPPGCLALARWPVWSAGLVGRHANVARGSGTQEGARGPLTREGGLSLDKLFAGAPEFLDLRQWSLL